MWALDKVETDLLIIFHLTIKRGGTAISIKLVKNKNIHAEEKAVSHVHKYPFVLQAVFYFCNYWRSYQSVHSDDTFIFINKIVMAVSDIPDV